MPLIFVVTGALAFAASGGFHHKTLEAAMTWCAGTGVVLSSLSTPMREISEEAQKWSLRLGVLGTGACLGLLVRLIFFR
jgi:hypothetical protein